MENTHLQEWITNFQKPDNVKNSPTVYNELKYYCVKVSQYAICSYLWSEYRKIQTRNNSVFGHFSCSVLLPNSESKKDQVQTMKYCKFTKTLKNSTDFNTGRLNNKLPRRGIFIVPCVWHQYV